jgi:hypothetical protein
MMMKTKIFIAKSFAKKHYKGAMDAIKTFKADKAGGKMFTKIKTTGKKIPSFVKSNLKALRKPIGMKEKAIAAGSKIKTFASKNKTALIVGGGAAGTVAGYQAGKKKGVGQMRKSYEKSVLASSAKELGYKNFKQVQKLPMKDKNKIAQRAARKYLKSGADYITFYS